MTWKEVLAPALSSPKMQEAKKFLKKERETKNIYPDGKSVFRAFDLCTYDNTKVVILGQDPYHTPGTADGLAFSTKQSKTPKSLEIIFKEIYKDLNIQYFHNETFEEFFPTNNLENWANNGFLLLNTSFTVEEGKPNSHANIGWDEVIKQVFKGLNKKDHQVVFLLWGNEAKKYKGLIDPKSKHIFFEANHPASEIYNPGKGGFYGCRHFSIIRDILPTIDGRNIFQSANLDSCFDSEKAKKLVRENYPKNADSICDYIDKQLIIHVPFNKEIYWDEIRKFEKMISTKY
jgi:uracil-DNA glycosylase